jgi:hypothetical protein
MDERDLAERSANRLIPQPEKLTTDRARRPVPSHVVCACMGNSQKVARKHYLQVTPDHIAKALKTESEGGRGEAKQNPKQQAAAMDRIITQIVQEAQQKMRPCKCLLLVATLCTAPTRMGRDSNPRYPCGYGSFQDCCLKPLGHPSVSYFIDYI